MNKQNETPARKIHCENARLTERLLSRLSCGTALWSADEGRLVCETGRPRKCNAEDT